jgi:hypothetical protein
MMLQEFRHLRMHAQRLAGEPFDTPESMVGWHLAVQAQDWAGTKWGIGQRCAGVDDAGIDRLLNEGALLRTHVLRPTWHLVLPEDIRWLLALTGPRVEAANAGRYRQLGLDEATLARSSEIAAGSLAGGTFLTRAELAERLEAAGIATEGQRMAHLLMHAELSGVICSGPRRGKQFTYALLDERVPPAPAKDRDEAVTELARRYLASHGPATPHDMAWWSGLTVTDCRRGIAALGNAPERAEIDGTTWWYRSPDGPVDVETPLSHLLPAFDEYFIGFRQHQVAWDREVRQRYDTTRELWAANLVAVDGRIVGGWRRAVTAREVRVTATAPLALDAAQRDAFNAAAEAYGRFLGLPVVIDDAIA